MSQTVAWVAPASASLEAFLQSFVINAANPMDAQGAKRADNLIPRAVSRVRAAIATGNRIPLSQTAGSVPPEAEWHVLVIVAESLATSVPQLAEFVESERFQRMATDAKEWIRSVEKGELAPSYPTNPDTTTVPKGPEWGDLYGTEVGGLSLGKIDVTTD
jgi:hypothetical protein